MSLFSMPQEFIPPVSEEEANKENISPNLPPSNFIAQLEEEFRFLHENFLRIFADIEEDNGRRS